MLLGLCALSVLLIPHMQAGSTLFYGLAITPTATCAAGNCRFPMSRRCTLVWSWPSPLLARALLT